MPAAVAEPPVAEPLPSGPSDAALARVPEAAIQSAWVAGVFRGAALRTTDGEPVRVLAPGRLNRDSGPDVADARVEIGGVVWAGSVEVHRTSAEWEAHGHDRDPAYRGVVLHAVLSADRRTGTLRRDDGSPLPEVVLMPHLPASLRALVHAHHTEPREAPTCGPRWAEVPPEAAAAWVRACGRTRLRERTARLARAYTQAPQLDRLLVRRAVRALGYEPNADAMTALADRLPLGRLRAFGDPADVLALVLGAAGWLAAPGLLGGATHFAARDASGDAGLAERFARVGAGVVPMDRAQWKRGGRPANAPRTRLAQAAAWLAPGGPLRHDAVPRLADALAAGTVAQGVEAVVARLRAPTADGTPRLGADRARAVLADAVLPVLALDAELRGDVALDERVGDALAALPAAADRVTRRFADVGFRARSALDAQGLHRLARDFCDEGRCAQCAVGQRLYPALARLGRR